jgi:hypothetical protein
VVLALGACRKEGGVDEALEVMAQGRCRQVDVVLDVTRGGTIRSCLDDAAQNFQTHWVAECCELVGVALEFGGHILLLILSKKLRKVIFDKNGTISFLTGDRFCRSANVNG